MSERTPETQLSTFLADLPETLNELQRCLAQNDLANLSALANRLHGMADSCGLGPITECARKLTGALQASGELPALEVLVRDLVSLCREPRLRPPGPADVSRAAIPHAEAKPNDRA